MSNSLFRSRDRGAARRARARRARLLDRRAPAPRENLRKTIKTRRGRRSAADTRLRELKRGSKRGRASRAERRTAPTSRHRRTATGRTSRPGGAPTRTRHGSRPAPTLRPCSSRGRARRGGGQNKYPPPQNPKRRGSGDRNSGADLARTITDAQFGVCHAWHDLVSRVHLHDFTHSSAMAHPHARSNLPALGS